MPARAVDMSATALDDGVIKVNITVEGNFTLMRMWR